MSAELSKKVRYDNVDLIKAAAIFFVVTMHSAVWKVDFISNGSGVTLIQYIARNIIESVPVFVMINGFLLLGKPLDLNKHIKKTIKVFLITMIWALIMIVSKSLIWGEQLALKSIVQNLLQFRIGNKYAGVLWFLLSLLTLYIIFPVLHTIYNNKKMFKYTFTVVAFFSIGVNFISLFVEVISLFIESQSLKSLHGFVNQFNPFSNLMFLFYFLLGGMIYRYRDKLKEKKVNLVLIASGILSWCVSAGLGIWLSNVKGETYMVNYNYSQVFLAITILGGYALSTHYKDKGRFYNKIIASLSKNSMGIYVLHTIIIALVETKFYIYGASFPVRVAVALAITIACWLITVVMKKIPVVDNLFKL